MNEEKLQQQIQVANSAVTSTMIIELIVQLFLKGTMDDLILLIIELQYIKNYQELDIVLPAFLELVYEKIELIVEFKYLNPDALLKMIDQDLSVKKLMFKDKDEGGENDAPVMTESFMTFLFVVGLFIMIFAIVLLVLNSSKKLEKHKQIVIDLVLAALVWNGVFQSLTFGYLS